MKLYKQTGLFLAAGALIASTSCTTNPYTGESQASKAAVYGGAGAAAGALTGYLAGGKNAKGALIGAAIGGAAGGGYGYYRDVQEKKLRDVLVGTGVQVKKEGDNIRLIMPGNITFASGSSDLKGSFFKTLNSVAIVLKEYNKTNVIVSGHTDSDGDESKNITLSQERATTVADYLNSQGVAENRLTANGYGSSRPVASNKIDEGKAQNRRVEITIAPKN